MATRADKQSELNRITQEIAKLQRELAQLETDLANSRANPALADLITSQERTIARTQANIATLEQRATDVQAQIDAIPADTPPQSAAAEVATSGAGATQNPAPPPTSVAADTPPGDGAPPTEVRTLANTQNVPDASTPETKAGGDPGVGPNEDAASPGPKTINPRTGSFTEAFSPKPNVLAQFASYTYNIGWYLVPNAFATPESFQAAPKSVVGFHLLAQSGGIASDYKSIDASGETTSTHTPGSSNGDLGTVTVTAKRVTRSKFFKFDYYLDNLEIETWMPNTNLTQMANSAITYKFTVTEPYGITLISNLRKACQELYPTHESYATCIYVLLIKFYGYDDNGKLVAPTATSTTAATDDKSVLTKFFPFRIQTIKFRVANKLVEYEIVGVPLGHDIGFSANRGVIPAPVQLSGSTVKDVLAGGAGAGRGGQGGPRADEGRQSNPTPSDTSPGVTGSPEDNIPGNGA